MKLFFKKLGEGRTIIILHGLFGLSDNWATLGRLFAKNYEVYLVDLRNHGHSPHHHSNTFVDMTADLLELIQDENISKPIIIGHSLGGKLAMHFTLKYPDLVSLLIPVDVAPVNYPKETSNYHSRYIDALSLIDLNSFTTRAEAEDAILDVIPDKGLMLFFAKSIYWTDEKKLAWRFNLNALGANLLEIFEGFSTLKDEVAPVNTPTLFVKGDRSDYIIDAYHTDMFYYFPNSEITIIENAGHWVQAQQPELFYEAVLRFIMKY